MTCIPLRLSLLVTDATHAARAGRTLVVALIMLMAALFLVALPASAQDATDANLAGKDIEAMLPAQAAGWVRASARSHDERPVLEASYQKEGVPYGIELFLGYDAAHRRTVRGFLENVRANRGEAAVQEIERKGRPLHLIESASEGRRGLVVRSEAMAAMFLICGEAPTCTVPDPEAARSELFALYDDFGVDRLAAFRMADGGPEVEAPAGFTAYAADLDAAQVAFAHPEGWTVEELYRQTGFVQGVTVVRDAAAAEALFADGLSLSSEDTSRLVTPGNAIVTIAVMGEGLEAESFLESLIRQAPLHEPTVVQAPTETTVSEHNAFEAAARGQDADGRSAVQRQLAFTAEGVLFSVTILQPAAISSEVEEAVQRLLDSLRVTIR